MRIFVTGGNRGIGAAIVRRAMALGHDVAFSYRTQGEVARALVQELSSSYPEQRCETIELDLCDRAAIETLPERLEIEDKGLDGVVNNAGMTSDGLLFSMEDEQWDRVLETNLGGSFRVIRVFLSHFLAQKSGAFVNFSSIVARGVAGQANYAASKAGIEALTRSVAAEYGRKGIRCNAVSPGMIETDMTQQGLAQALRERWKLAAPIKKGRLGRPEEVAAAVLFLLSEEASLVNGQILGTDAGFGGVL